VAVTSTPDGVTARCSDTVTLSTTTCLLRDDCGSDTDGTGSGYGLAHAFSSSMAPGSEGSGEKSLGDGCGVASVIKTAGRCERSLSSVPVGVSERCWTTCWRAGDVCV